MSVSRATVPVAESTVEVDGVELYVRAAGDGPDVVVLHGGPGAHHDYLLPQFDALASGRRLRYYDQRGGGRSAVSRDVPVGWREHVGDLLGLVEAWNIDRATILGYSWGGLLAMLFAIQHADRIERLALVSPGAVTAGGRAEFERRFTARMRDPHIIEARQTLQRSGLRERNPEEYRQRIFELSIAGYFKDPESAQGLTPFRVTARTQQAVWESLDSYDLSDDLSQLDVPALLIHGRHDPIPLSSSEHTARLLNARLEVFEDSGHVPYVEEHQRFVQVLDAFLPRKV